MSETKQRKVRLPNFIEALLPILVMMGLMIYGLNFSNEVYYDAHMPLVVSIVVACIIGALCGHSFSDMLAGMIERLNATMEAILILCTVGLLVASFIMSGTIPALIYYGLDLLTPKLFLPVGCILCAIVATDLQAALAEGFNLNPLVLIPILVVIAACIIKLPGLVGIALSVGTGVLFAIVFQGVGSLADLFSMLHYGYSFETSNELATELLNRGGMDNTMWTINLILLAVAYGGALERCGCVETLFGGLKKHLHSVGSLILATLLTSLFCDATMCDQFLGIGVPAPLYEDKYDEMGLSRNMLSRTLEDCGTLWAVMFPWTGCGAYQMGVLGISPFQYFPFAFVNLLNPIYAAITAYMGRNIFWADGAYTNILGKTTMHKPAGAPEEAHARALKNLEALRAAGKAPIPTGKAAAKV